MTTDRAREEFALNARVHIAALLAAVALCAAACTAAPPSTPAPSVTPVSAPHSSAQGTPSPSPAGTFPADWPLPDRVLTPGAVTSATDTSRICPHVDPALEAARPTSAEKAQVYAAYGLSYPQPSGEYELDHLVPIELGGQPDSAANEFPERNDTPDPAMIAKWHLSPAFVHNSKDILEDTLHYLVCSGRVPLNVAQQAIASDWRAAYVTYVEGMQP